MKLRTLLLLLAVLAVVGALAWGAMRVVRATTATTALELPTTRVKQGRVTLTVACRGELQGGNSEMLTAPMIGGGDMAITSLREPGELVSPGDVVVQFDTTEQEYKLKEAEADLAEAGQVPRQCTWARFCLPLSLSSMSGGRARDSSVPLKINCPTQSISWRVRYASAMPSP